MSIRKKILLSGATGFLGHALSSLQEHQVETAGRRANDHVRTDLKEFSSIATDYDCLLHFASGISVRTPATSTDFIHTQLAESFSFLRAFAMANPKGHIVYPSSGGTIYGNPSQRKPLVETSPLLGTTPYALSKVSHESFLYNLSRETGVRCTILRIANPFGQNKSPEKKQGLLGVAINCLLENRPLDLLDPLNIVRDFLYIEDFKRAVNQVITAQPRGPFQIYNLGSGTGTEIGTALEVVQKVFGKTLQFAVKENPFPGVPWNVLDVQKFKSDFEWQPIFDLRSGLEELKRGLRA